MTGGCSGIGLETAKVLHTWNATIILGCRNSARARHACKSVEQARLGDVVADNRPVCMMWELDLSSFLSIRSFVSKFHRSGLDLHILVNNAGIRDDSLIVSPDNIEMHYHINHLGPFLLTNLLLPSLRRSRWPNPRIVHVSSSAHAFGKIDRIQYGLEKRNTDARLFESTQSNRLEGVYGDTKLMQVMFSNELQRRIDLEIDKNCKFCNRVISLAIHPGFVSTEFGADDERMLQTAVLLLRPLIARNSSQGAITQIIAATLDSPDIVGGQYMENGAVSLAADRAYDKDDWEWLWNISSILTDLNDDMRSKNG